MMDTITVMMFFMGFILMRFRKCQEVTLQKISHHSFELP